ncbi:hypothetical protein SAMN05421824_0972 [Hyunsoonleella jejuensis]|uniref:Uncharacterized protein n=1 Tax=Hyunsoonleella jejuensis TaxID=419940 RepID=A0A1H9CPK1_9FLAO|nr:hypothetical protein [Hyunsoonleella jejuensis]SEQ03084.1 hypothetical protein SAMN05421824_0972 [Hyunsoonleella jejuensis]
MAVLGRIIKENVDDINIRAGEVVGDVIIERDYLQLRTYAMNDLNRERGSKQNIQFTKEKAREFRDLLNAFLGE